MTGDVVALPCPPPVLLGRGARGRAPKSLLQWWLQTGLEAVPLLGQAVPRRRAGVRSVPRARSHAMGQAAGGELGKQCECPGCLGLARSVGAGQAVTARQGCFIKQSLKVG